MTNIGWQFFLVFVGGGFGASLRFLSSLSFERYGSLPFYFSTLFVNIVGTFLFVMGARLEHHLDELYRPLFFVGFLGALTTFSTFSFEASRAIQLGRYDQFFAIILLNIIFGVAIGIWVLR